MAVTQQVLCTFIACFLCTSVGFIVAWPSSTVEMFSSANTTLNRPMSSTEQALFGSIFSLTAVLCTPFSCVLLNVLGTKYSCLLFALPQVVSWALISVSTSVEMILLCVFISGMGGCLFTLVPLLISEISQDSIRGAMLAGVNVFYGTGIMLSYVFGGYLHHQTMHYVCLLISVISIFMMVYVRESPTYLMRKGMEQEAAKSIAFYRSVPVEHKEVLQELETIRRSLNPKNDNTAEEESLTVKPAPSRHSVRRYIKNSKSTQRGIVIVFIIALLCIFQGMVGVQVYAEPLFNQAMPHVSGNLLSICFGLLNTVAGFVAAFIVDIYGRRALILYSSLGTTTCCIVLATQAQLQWGPSWLNAVFLYLFCIAYTFGAGTIPYILMAEFFVPEVRSLMVMLAQEWAWICNFVVVFLLSVIMSAFGLATVFYLFAAFGLLCLLFCYRYLPETNGLPVQDIQTLLLDKKR